MSKLTGKPSKKVLNEQDQKDAKKFLTWTAAITLFLLVLIYILYSNTVG
ncbi:MAG: hypothetical protein ACOYOA_09225 [Saprospiraceae bacterium]